MRRVATIALIVAWVASFACAQRSASHGGFSGQSGPSLHGAAGHSAPAFRGGFTGSAPSRVAAPPRSGFGAPGSSYVRPAQYPHIAGFTRNEASRFQGQSVSADRSRHRMPYRSPRDRGDRDRDDHRDRDFRHIHPGWPVLYNPYLYTPYFLGSNYLDYPEDEENGAPVAQGNLSPGYDSQPPDQGQQQEQPPYQGQPELPPWPSDNPPPAAAPLKIKPLVQETAEPVTIVFNDGRPSEQIHNYLLTPATLFIFDKQRREIPIGKLDLVATAKANRDAGVDFSLPGPSK